MSDNFGFVVEFAPSLPTPLMKTFVLVLLFFYIKTNAQIIQIPGTPTTSTTPTSTTPTSTLSTTSSSPTSTSATTSRSSSTSSASTTSSTSSNSDISTTSSLVTSPVVTSVDGTLVTTAVVTVVGPSSSTSSSQPTPSAAPQSDTSSGLSTGSIIGLSVAGGVAVIGLIAFFIWKLTRKRFPDFDDGEPIKWPDLNPHGGDLHPLPNRFDSESLSRVDSNHSSVRNDPYAVPPLPHLNPNQPYRDDPGAVGGYDPYRGPIPGTIEQVAGQEQYRGQEQYGGQERYGESFQMAEMNSGGRTSPGPNAAFGRRSPGPKTAFGSSLGPQAAYAGRMSPRPQAAYGGSTSPVPPEYDAYGTR